MCDLIDTGLAPEIYADDVGAAEDLGVNCRSLYFTWARQPGTSIMMRVVVLKLIRPKAALRAGKVLSMLATASEVGRVLLHS